MYIVFLLLSSASKRLCMEVSHYKSITFYLMMEYSTIISSCWWQLQLFYVIFVLFQLYRKLALLPDLSSILWLSCLSIFFSFVLSFTLSSYIFYPFAFPVHFSTYTKWQQTTNTQKNMYEKFNSHCSWSLSEILLLFFLGYYFCLLSFCLLCALFTLFKVAHTAFCMWFRSSTRCLVGECYGCC